MARQRRYFKHLIRPIPLLAALKMSRTRFTVPARQNVFSLWVLLRGFLISVGVSTHTAFLEFMFLFVASFWICDVHLCDIKITVCCNSNNFRSSKRL
ncbi:hypothetical protein BD769DRAFT_1413476 [Suillus cothurnatus]|nr:hypothetical protein BD769DRAFT_1413476 [Suillus cothurnatus]